MSDSDFPRADIARPRLIGVPAPCARCGGSGVVVYKWVEGGRCFGCQGNGRGPDAKVRHFPAAWDDAQCEAHEQGLRDRQAKRDAAKVAKQQAKASKAAAELDALVCEGASACEHSIARDMASRFARFGSLSEKQVAFFRRLVEQEANKVAIAAKREQDRLDRVAGCAAGTMKGVPTDGERHVVTGVVTFWKADQETEFEWIPPKFKVETEEGWSLWGTVPSAWREHGNIKGARVSFACRPKASDDDPAFGFFQRPTKLSIELVEAAESDSEAG